MNVIEFDSVVFGYGGEGATVLDGVSFAVGAGEFVALVGDNGSGKSTVAKLCDAFLAPDAGTVRVLGRDVGGIAGTDEQFALRREVGFVFQNPDDQLVASLVVDEVAFGPRNLGLPREDIVGRVDAALRDVGMTDAVGRDVNTLSGGQRQRIAIADALAMQPKLLVLDEPTSMIDAQGRQDVMNVLERLRNAGMAILLITHDPAEAARADRVLRMEDGHIHEKAPSDISGKGCDLYASLGETSLQESEDTCSESLRSRGEISRLRFASLEMTRGEKDELLARNDTTSLIQFEGVSFRYDGTSSLGIDLLVSQSDNKLVLDNIDLSVYEGELLAIAGPNGSGKTTLIQHMNGLLRPSSGQVLVAGTSTATKSGANAARRVVGITFQYPERSFFADTVHDEIAFGPRNLRLPEAEVTARVQAAMEQLALPYNRFAQRHPFDLSGGEQRKVAIAGVLAMRPRVLVLDEPCAGMDLPSHAHLIELLQQLKATGQTIVLVTHDQHDIDTLADRVFTLP